MTTGIDNMEELGMRYGNKGELGLVGIEKRVKKCLKLNVLKRCMWLDWKKT